MQKRMLLLSVLIALAFIGIADSWYLTEHALDGSALSCGIDGLDGCNTVAQSPYSRFLGIPLAIYGMAFYVGVFVLGFLMCFRQDAWPAVLLRFLTGLGALLSVVFVLIQLFLIQAICIYCLLSALVSFLLFWLGLRLRKHSVLLPEAAAIPWGRG